MVTTVRLSPLKAVAFDLDGTLVDSAPDIAHALNTALQEAGLLQGQPAFDVATVRSWVGDGPDMTIARALQSMRARGDAVAGADATALRRGFDQATFAAPLAHGVVYPQIDLLLRQLGPLCPLVVVTNKPRALACAVLEAAKLASHFAVVYGADRPDDRKPSPAMLQQAARDLGIATRDLLMVGDGPADIRAARAAGSCAVLAGWGYGGADAQGTEPCIHQPMQLADMVRSAVQGERHAHRR